MSAIRLAAGVVVATVLVASLYWLAEGGDTWASTATAIDGVADWLRSLGWRTPLVSLLLFIAQAIFAPLPVIPLIAANGILYGPLLGAALSWVGALLGAAASFLLARYASERWIRNRSQAGPLKYLDALSNRGGFWVVVIARLIPIISLDFIGYAAGLSRMSFSTYIFACALGQTPAVVGYSILGHDAVHAQGLTIRLAVFIALSLAAFVLGRYWFRRSGLL